MRASDLLGRHVVDADGIDLGVVLDIRMRKDEDGVGERPEEGWTIDGVVVGPRRSFPRAGYAYGNVRRPVVLAMTMRALGRSLRYVPWSDLRRTDDTMRAAGRRDQLLHPGQLT